MTQSKQVSFDQYLDIMFASPNRLDGCVNMLSVFLEEIESCRDNLSQRLPSTAPSILDQVAAVAGRAQRLHLRIRETAEKRGPEFQTTELGAVLWWAGMAAHKAVAAAGTVGAKLTQNVWEDAYFEIHALMFDTISALSLLSVAEGMMQCLEAENVGRERPN